MHAALDDVEAAALVGSGSGGMDVPSGLGRMAGARSGQWYSLESVKRAVLDSGGHRLGVLTPGAQFGVYQVGPCVGEGGMARVYQAEHAGLRRQVALKVLVDGFARHPDGRERFLREARIAAAVKHPNVVNIFDVGVHEDIPYLVMELLEGQDLERLLATRGALPEALIVDIMVPVVAGLIAVHDAGIVHRDLKPGNIFLARGRYYDLEPKLLDFGISKAPGPDLLKLTTSRTVMGTPLYVSPEGLRGGEMTPLSDQYSLGVVMYECATGKTPFPASNFPELSNLISAGRFIPATQHKPELSKRMAGIIDRAMSLDPQKRFRDLRELGRELLQLAGQRTRITWALSFGDRNTLTSTPIAHVVERRAVAAASLRPRPRAVALTAFVVFALAQILVLGAGVAGWLSGRFSLRDAVLSILHPPTALRSAAVRGVEVGMPAATPPPTAVLVPPPALVSPAEHTPSPGNPAAAAVVAAAVATAAAPLVVNQAPDPMRGRAPGEPSGDRTREVRREGSSVAMDAPRAPANGAAGGANPSPTSELAAASRSPSPASANPASAAEHRRAVAAGAAEADPDWALPPAASAQPVTPPRGSEGLGANGAPILD